MMPERVQELVDEMAEPKDWDMNFKAIKAKRKARDLPPGTKRKQRTSGTCFVGSAVHFV